MVGFVADMLTAAHIFLLVAFKFNVIAIKIYLLPVFKVKVKTVETHLFSIHFDLWKSKVIVALLFFDVEFELPES